MGFGSFFKKAVSVVSSVASSAVNVTSSYVAPKNYESPKAIVPNTPSLVDRAKNKLNTYASSDYEKRFVDYASKELDLVGTKYQTIDDAGRAMISRMENILHNHNDRISQDFSRAITSLFINANNYTGTARAVYDNFRKTLDSYTQNDIIQLPIQPKPVIVSQPSNVIHVESRFGNVVRRIAGVGLIATVLGSCSTSSGVAKPESLLDEAIERLDYLSKLPPIKAQVPLPEHRDIVMLGDKEIVVPPRLGSPDNSDITKIPAISKLDISSFIDTSNKPDNSISVKSIVTTSVISDSNNSLESKVFDWKNDYVYWDEFTRNATLRAIKHYNSDPKTWVNDSKYVQENIISKYGKDSVVPIMNRLVSDLEEQKSIDSDSQQASNNKPIINNLDKKMVVDNKEAVVKTPVVQPTLTNNNSNTLESKVKDWNEEIKGKSEMYDKVTQRSIDRALAINFLDDDPRKAEALSIYNDLVSDYGVNGVSEIKNELDRIYGPNELTKGLIVVVAPPRPNTTLSAAKTTWRINVEESITNIPHIRTILPLSANSISHSSEFKDWHEEINGKSRIYLEFIQRTIDRGESENFDKFPESLSAYIDLTADYGVKGVEEMGEYLDNQLGPNEATIGLEKQVLHVNEARTDPSFQQR